MSARPTTPASGDGLREQPTCRSCGIPLKPYREYVERFATDDEVAIYTAATAACSRENVARQRALQGGAISGDEAVQRQKDTARRYHAALRPLGGVAVIVPAGRQATAMVLTHTGWGFSGNGEFCTRGCGFWWAVALAEKLRRGVVAIVDQPS